MDEDSAVDSKSLVLDLVRLLSFPPPFSFPIDIGLAMDLTTSRCLGCMSYQNTTCPKLSHKSPCTGTHTTQKLTFTDLFHFIWTYSHQNNKKRHHSHPVTGHHDTLFRLMSKKLSICQPISWGCEDIRSTLAHGPHFNLVEMALAAVKAGKSLSTLRC